MHLVPGTADALRRRSGLWRAVVTFVCLVVLALAVVTIWRSVVDQAKAVDANRHEDVVLRMCSQMYPSQAESEPLKQCLADNR
jgi:hypothetical protein